MHDKRYVLITKAETIIKIEHVICDHYLDFYELGRIIK